MSACGLSVKHNHFVASKLSGKPFLFSKNTR